MKMMVPLLMVLNYPLLLMSCFSHVVFIPYFTNNVARVGSMVSFSLTTDSDLHYCEETQLAAAILACSTHNTQIFT